MHVSMQHHMIDQHAASHDQHAASHDLLCKNLSLVFKLEELICEFNHNMVLGYNGLFVQVNLLSRLLQLLFIDPINNNNNNNINTARMNLLLTVESS